MGFIKKSIGTEQGFGIDLKELRELRGWSEVDLSKSSGIPEYIITALEKEDFSALSDPAYSERHVRVLARVLDGRAPFLVGKYRTALKENGLDKKHALHNYSFTQKIRRSAFFTPTRYFSFILIVPLFMLLGWYVWSESRIFSSSPMLIINEPFHDAVIQAPRVIISGNTDPAAAIVVNGINAVVEPDGCFKIALDVPRGLNKLEITAKRRYGIQTQDVRYITYSPTYGPEPEVRSIIYSSDSLDAFFATSTTSTDIVIDQ
jgi:hypothetical protein